MARSTLALGVLSEQGGSLQGLARTGQDRRFIDQYLARYTQQFASVYYFSYLQENERLPPGCTLVPNSAGWHRWTYSCLLPVLQRKYFRRCKVLRVMQLTGSTPAIISKLLYRTPFVATYGYDYAAHAKADGSGSFRAFLFAARTKLALRLADRVIVTTTEMSTRASRDIDPSRIVLVPNGVDTHSFCPSEESAAQVPLILFVGRLSPQKNLLMLLEAVALLKRPVTIRLVGTGPMATALAGRAGELNLQLQLPGVVPHEQLPSELQKASVFVLPSLIEGHPKALLEAMSCGCVCVGAASPGIKELIEDGVTGLLAKPTPQKFAHALDQALESTELRAKLAVNARRKIVEEFDIRVTLGGELDLLRHLAESVRS